MGLIFKKDIYATFFFCFFCFFIQKVLYYDPTIWPAFMKKAKIKEKTERILSIFRSTCREVSEDGPDSAQGCWATGG